jgi:hypothetical protein
VVDDFYKGDWVKVKEADVGNDTYGLLISRKTYNPYANQVEIPFKKSGSVSKYTSSDVRKAVNQWYSKNAVYMPEIMKRASVATSLDLEDSKPKGYRPGRAYNDVMFIPSKKEAQLVGSNDLLAPGSANWLRTLSGKTKAYIRMNDTYKLHDLTVSTYSIRPAVWVYIRTRSQ